MRQLGINVISTNKSNTKREAVYIMEGKGSTRKGPRLKSITFHQDKTLGFGEWYPPQPIR